MKPRSCDFPSVFKGFNSFYSLWTRTPAPGQLVELSPVIFCFMADVVDVVFPCTHTHTHPVVVVHCGNTRCNAAAAVCGAAEIFF